MAGKFNIGASIALDGEKEFKQAIREINKDVAVLSSEMDKVTASFNNNADSVAALTAKQDVLERQLLNQRDKVEVLRQALANAAKQYGEADRRTKDWQISLNKAEAELSKTKNELDKVTKEIDQYGKEVTESTKKSSILGDVFKGGFFANIAAQAIQAVVSTLKELVRAAFDAADELKRLSDVTGLTTDALQELQYIGDEVGVSLDTISSAMARLINNMQMAKAGAGDAYKAFQALGVEFRDSATGELRDSTEVFYEIIDALGQMSNETERTAYAQDLLGRSASELNPLIEAGAAAMRGFAQEAHEAGAIMSEEVIKALDEAGDRLAHWWQMVLAFFGTLLVKIGYFLNGQELATGKSLDSLESLGNKIEDVTTAYDNASSAAEQSLKKQIGLWTDLSKTANKSFIDIKNAIDSQIRWYQDYNTNLFNLSQRNIEGITDLVAKLSDGSLESASIVAGLAKASDEDLQILLDKMAEVEDRRANFARQLGEIQTGTKKQLADLFGGIRQEAEAGLDASTEALKAGWDTMQGYIDGVLDQKENVVKAFKEVSSAALKEGINAPWDIHSPSKVMMDAAKNIWDGWILQTQRLENSISQSFADAASGAIRAVENISAPSALSRTASASEDSGQSAGRPIYVNLNVVSEIEGRAVARATRQFMIEEDALAGPNLISGAVQHV